MIVGAHNRGECPEEIHDLLPSNDYTVADIYLIIAYYLKNKAKIDIYLAKREREAERFWKTLEDDEKYQARITKLKNFKKKH